VRGAAADRNGQLEIDHGSLEKGELAALVERSEREAGLG